MQIDILHPLAFLRWSSKCSVLPVGICFAQAVLLEDRLYLGGGMTSGNHRDDARLYVYTHTTDMWSMMETPVLWFALISYHSQLVLVGGRNYIDEKILGPVTNKLWTKDKHTWLKSIPPMTKGRYSASAVEFAGNILVAGGADNITDVEVYNGHHWTTIHHLPDPCQHMKSAVLNGHLYLMGGILQGKRVYCAPLDILCKPSENPPPSLWKRHPDVPHEYFSPVVIGNRIIAVGGGIGSPSSSIHAYSPHTQSWVHVGDMPIGLGHTCTAVLPNGKLMIIGGWSSTSQLNSCVYQASLNGK